MIHALGGGSAGGAVRSWGDSYFETLQPYGTRVACMVDGEPCIAQAGLSRWSLVSPSVVAQAYAAANPRPTPSGGVKPNTRYLFVGSHMEFGAPILNDGSQWYWPLVDGAPQPGSFGTTYRNDEPYTIVRAGSLLSSIQDPPMPFLALSYRGGSWVVDDDPPVPPNGGGTISGDTTPTPTVALSSLKTLPAGIASGATMDYSAVLGTTGYFSPTASLGQGGTTPPYPRYPNGMFSNDAFQAGDHRTGIDATFELASCLPSHLLVEYDETCPGYCQVGVIGDSLSAQRRPGVEGSREGIIYAANHAAIAAGSKVRFATFGNGGAHSSDILHRADAVADVISDYCTMMLIQISTANQAYTGVADANARWAAYLVVKASIEGRTGMIVRAIQMSPPPSFDQSAENLAGWARMRELISAEGGVDLHNSIVAEGTTQMSAEDSTDGAHLTQSGVNKAAPALRAQTEAILIAAGGDV